MMLLAAVAVAALSLAEGQELLRVSDVSMLAPESFRARIVLRGVSGAASNFEVWRSGSGRTLVRFLDSKERGKFLIKRERTVYFIGPRAKQPVRLPPSYRLSGGASLDQILGTRYAAEYELKEALAVDDDLVALELVASGEAAPYPRVSYVVRRSTRRPVRVEFKLANGRLTGAVEFVAWAEGLRVHPRRLRVTDALNPKASAEVEISDVHEQPVPEGLFSLADARVRAALPAVP